MREVGLKQRKKNLPPDKLYKILCGIYPKDAADKIYKDLTGLEPPKESE